MEIILNITIIITEEQVRLILEQKILNRGIALEEDFYILDPYVDLNTGIFATFMLIVFGGIAGFIPARRAAKIKPIEALNDK